MPKRKTEKPAQPATPFIVKLVLDESGSMNEIKDKTISGLNEYIQTLQGDPVTKYSEFSLTRFNTDEVVNDPISLVAKTVLLTKDSYRPRSGTPLYDAIGKAIRDLEDHLVGRSVTKVTFVVMTDGEENSSKEYTFESVKQLIAEKEKFGWVFVYLGANQDAWTVGNKYGFAQGNTITWYTSKVQDTYKLLADATVTYAASDSVGTRSFWAKKSGQR